MYPTAKSPMNCAVSSINDQLSITFARNIVESDVIRHFFRQLASLSGLDIRIVSNDWGWAHEMRELWGIRRPGARGCPLCRRNLHGKGDAPSTGNSWYPIYEAVEERASSLLSKWLTFIAVSVIGLSLLINILGDHEVWWSLYLMPCVLYAWLFIRHTLMSKSHLGGKIVVQSLGLSGIFAGLTWRRVRITGRPVTSFRS